MKKEDMKTKDSDKVINDIITLKDIELKVRKGELLMVVGKVGSGKTSLLSAIQGEMLDIKSELLNTIKDNQVNPDNVKELIKLSGEKHVINIDGSTSLVQCTPWIMNKTL